MARPMAVPTMADSASGVSMTRSSPNRACRPSVIRKTPPSLPTSSPMITTFGSAAMAESRPVFSAFARVRVWRGLAGGSPSVAGPTEPTESGATESGAIEPGVIESGPMESGSTGPGSMASIEPIGPVAAPVAVSLVVKAMLPVVP
ncbi:hypothetical protein FMEAI12_2620003 [Parafrankia sp. Ea1.12]|nr:hypothetical protein FMEAI12_2620003 [Parafrankia sp. Ea1.12]